MVDVLVGAAVIVLVRGTEEELVEASVDKLVGVVVNDAVVVVDE